MTQPRCKAPWKDTKSLPPRSTRGRRSPVAGGIAPLSASLPFFLLSVYVYAVRLTGSPPPPKSVNILWNHTATVLPSRLSPTRWVHLRARRGTPPVTNQASRQRHPLPELTTMQPCCDSPQKNLHRCHDPEEEISHARD